MNSALPFELPAISESDLRYAASLLRIDEAVLFDSARLSVAKSAESIDVAACPGSGKTTLLVAKLAMLIRNWKHSTRGICVLSHTNVARSEIEMCLGNTSSGRSLLAYPHYVGTIHGFVNEFLALPWLRSLGYPIKLIDTEQVLKRRWFRLGQMSPNTRYGLEQNLYDHKVLTIKSADCGVGPLRWGKGKKLGIETKTYKDIVKICQLSTSRGYFCYDEMFIWANELLDKAGETTSALRYRFPVVFIDEAQDNSEEQAAILDRVFQDGHSSVICQRFGDENQAIFDSLQTKGAATNAFPNSSKAIELANSHRFGQGIANIATPLAAIPLLTGLKGNGPKRVLNSGKTQGPHTIFLINEHCTKKVLDAFGNLLVSVFSQEELSQGSFFAVGQIHRPPEEEAAHKHPHHLRHYWPDYNPEFGKSEPTPQTLNLYISLGVSKAGLKGESSFAIERIAEGILRLASEGKHDLSSRKFRHRQILELLEHSEVVKEKYETLIVTFAVEREPLTKEVWLNHWRGAVLEIAEAITQSPLNGPAVDSLLAWNEHPTAANPATTHSSLSKDNIYRYPQDEPSVKIQLGSIHSVKGQTHTATLVLETFWKRHNLEKLAPWITGDGVGCRAADSGDQIKRIKLHYVAVTRPTHLLCLAVKRKMLEDGRGSLDSKKIQTLKRRGWLIDDLTMQLPLFHP